MAPDEDMDGACRTRTHLMVVRTNSSDANKPRDKPSDIISKREPDRQYTTVGNTTANVNPRVRNLCINSLRCDIWMRNRKQIGSSDWPPVYMQPEWPRRRCV